MNRPDRLVTGGSFTAPPRAPGLNSRPSPVLRWATWWILLPLAAWGLVGLIWRIVT